MSEQSDQSKQTVKLDEVNTSDKQPLTDKQPKVDKVTAVEKSESSKAAKVKDPRKVELGKRLAKISREAKERKARQRSEVENKQSPEENRERVRFAKEITDYIDFRYFIGGVTLVATFGGLYYSYERDKRESERNEQSERSEQREEKDSKAIDRRSQHSNKFVNNVKEKNDGSTSQGRENLQSGPPRCSIENL